MFEDYTYELLLENVLNNAPKGIDTRQGSIFYDAVSGILLKIAKLYTDLDLVFELVFLDTTSGEYLDKKASEYGITRLQATKCCYYFTYEGTAPDIGERFYTDGLYFALKKDENNILYLEAEKTGTDSNNIYSGIPAIPVNNIQGLSAASFGEIYEIGSDIESDENLRTRVREKIAGPAENGNKQHYKTWCESFDGIGRARIFPLWNGPNTVKAVLIDTEGRPCGKSKVEEVQEYIDPATKGYTAEVDGKTYTVGDGLGEGVANLGAHFTAVSADALNIDVELNLEIKAGYSKEDAKQDVNEALAAYFKKLVLESQDMNIVIRISSVGAIILSLDGILDYKNITLNGSSENIISAVDDVPILNEVIIL